MAAKAQNVSEIAAIIEKTIKIEGEKFTDDKNDSGGPTKYGITLETLARHRRRAVTATDVAALTIAEARDIYWTVYVFDPKFDALFPVSTAIAAEVVDTGVNCGVARATEFLQRTLNALNRVGRDYPDIEVDSACGPSTVRSLSSLLAVRGATEGTRVLLAALNCLQGAFYISLAERRPKDENYLYGWLLNRVA